MTDKVRIALIGGGLQAQTAYLPYLRKNRHVTIKALCDTDEAKLHALKLRFEIETVTTSYNRILNDESIDAVIITAPNYLHHPMALAALDYGKHVMLELPMALNSEQAEEMVTKAKEKKLLLALAHSNHFRPDTILMRQLMERKEIGRLTYAKTGWLRSTEKWHLTGWRKEHLSAGGGAFLTLGIPIIDMSLFVIGNRTVTAISGTAFKRNAEIEVEDSAVAQLRFADNAMLTLEVSWILHQPRDILYLNVYGTKGAALINPLEIHREMFNRLVNVAPSIDAKTIKPCSYQGQINAFVAAIVEDKPYPIPLNAGLLLTKISDAFYRSVDEGKEITLN